MISNQEKKIDEIFINQDLGITMFIIHYNKKFISND